MKMTRAGICLSATKGITLTETSEVIYFTDSFFVLHIDCKNNTFFRICFKNGQKNKPPLVSKGYLFTLVFLLFT